MDHARPGAAPAGMPDAQELVLRLTATVGRPSRTGIVGVSGSGKSELLAAVVDAVVAAGLPVLTALPSDPASAPGPGAAVVIDDAHALDDDALHALAGLAARDDIALVVATEPRDHRPPHRDLFATLAARGVVLTLAPITVAGVVARSPRHLPIAAATAIARTTGGNRAAADAAIAAVATRDSSESDGPILMSLVAEAISAWHHRCLRRLDRATLGVLTIAAAGSTPDPDTVAQTCDLDEAGALRAIDAARGSGFLGESDTFLADAIPALTAVVGAHQIASTRDSLIRVLLAHNALPLDRAIAAAAAGMVDADLASALVAHAGDARGYRAVTVWSAARAAGADPSICGRPLARVALYAGDLEVAAQVADRALVAADPATVAMGVRVAAAVAARRGSYSRAAQLFRWLGADRAGPDAAAGVIALLGAGDRDAAGAFLDAAQRAAPTTENSAAAQFAAGLAASLGEGAAPAVGTILRAVSSRTADTSIDTESAATVAVLMMLHTGDLAGAHAVLDRTGPATGVDETASDDIGATGVRRQLLRGWTAMMAGDLTAAAQSSSVTTDCHREALLAHALTVGVARRRGDPGALAGAWRDAQAVVAESEVDLFALLPLGELWLAAVRCGETDRLTHLAAEADHLLRSLGDPPLWSAAWHWYGVQAAILAGTPDALVPHARALGAAAPDLPYAAVLAGAGRVWLRVLQGADAQPRITVEEIDAAAHSLQRVGHAFDGARLAAEGALRVDDTRSATTLLQTARTIGGTTSRNVGGTTRNAPATSPGDGTAVSGPTASALLSEREAEVAEQLVLGLTYREIGAALFISAKTVEHHVARIRRRLGSGSRSDLLSTLRAAGYGTSTTPPP